LVLRRGREDEVGGGVEVSCPDKVDRFVVASWLSVPWDEMRGGRPEVEAGEVEEGTELRSGEGEGCDVADEEQGEGDDGEAVHGSGRGRLAIGSEVEGEGVAEEGSRFVFRRVDEGVDEGDGEGGLGR
jgi:hypothetical protein